MAVSDYIIWHNPRCSKSRQTLALLKEHGVVPGIRLYLDDAPDVAAIRAVLTALGKTPIEIMRTGESRFKELMLNRDSGDDTLIQAMADNLVLIEWPIVIHGSRAAMGRPPEAILTLIKP